MKSAAVSLAFVAYISVAVAQQSPVTTQATITSMTSTAATADSSTRPTTTFTVQVGVQHAFVPDTIHAIVGDTIRFEFNPTNHSVVKADFKDPCVPFEYHRRDEQTFYSGQKISQAGDEKPVWNLKVLDTNPTFFYCSGPGSCITWKMIGVINPNSTWSLENQLKYYANTTKFQLSPGDPYPDEAPQSSTSVLSATTKSTSTSTALPSSTSSSESSGGGSSGLSTGAIAGIAIGGAAVLILAAGLVWFCGRRDGIERGYRKSAAVQPVSMREDRYDRDSKSPGTQNSLLYPDLPSPRDSTRAGSPGQWANLHPSSAGRQSYMGHPTSPLSPGYGSGQSPVVPDERHYTGGSYYESQNREQSKTPEQYRDGRGSMAYQQPSELDGTHFNGHHPEVYEEHPRPNN